MTFDDSDDEISSEKDDGGTESEEEEDVLYTVEEVAAREKLGISFFFPSYICHFLVFYSIKSRNILSCV